MDKKVAFPGYGEKQRKLAKRESARETKQRNTLPPFLLVRSGALDSALICALITIPLAECVFMEHARNNVFAYISTVGCYTLPLMLGVINFAILNNTKHVIQKDLDSFRHGKKWLNQNAYESVRMATIMTRYASKNDRALFDRLISEPQSVRDEKLAVAIIQGHIKSHPEDKQKCLDTFAQDTMPPRLYQQLIKQNTR